MATVVFPKVTQNGPNEYWPLPPDYPELNEDYKRKARVNAAGLTGRPDLDVAGWHYFREEYLRPTGRQWYKTGYSESPDAHYQWVHDWSAHPLLIHAAPRGTCKTTINLEDILRKTITRPYWECALFLSTQKFISDRLGRLMDQIESNGHLIDDFGKLKPIRGSGQWNRGSCMELRNRSKVSAHPITGASLGTRPSGLLCLDDVEKSDDLVVTPADLRQHFERFFFNAVYPMSRSPGFNIPIRIIGTLYNRRMFIYWLYHTKDERIREFWKRVLMSIVDLDWDVLGEEFQETEKRRMGAAAYNAQYMNDPGTEADRVLSIHPELCTYWLEDEDEASAHDPLNSKAIVVSHALRGYSNPLGQDGERQPLPQPVVRPWADVLASMRRFITVDSCRTTTEMSDFSAIHVMGFENSEVHRDTLWSLECWHGKVRPAELVRLIYQMAIKWGVTLIGIEAYPVQSTFFEMAVDLLPTLFGNYRGVVPRVIKLNFPTKYTKADKIMGMEWRFRQFRMKLPLHLRGTNKHYTRLFWEIENFTEDLGLLDHDDLIDTLAMHQGIGKQRRAVGPDITTPHTISKCLLDGVEDIDGIPVVTGAASADFTPEVVAALLDRKYQQLEEEMGDELPYRLDSFAGEKLW